MELENLLEKLRMDHLETQLDTVCEQAAHQQMDYKAFLVQALQTEWQGRFQRGIEARLKQARFPWIKTLDQFEFDFQPSLDRKQVRELAGMSFVERSHNVILLGPPGVGKTHLAIALGVKAVEAGYSVLFLTLEQLMTRLVKAFNENRLERSLQQARRYERASLIVTSNKSFLDWGEVFNDPVLATAILDRLLHYSTTLNIKGESYRLKEKRKAGLLGRSNGKEEKEAVEEP
jgi:DNA replication protein DnaC